MVSEVYLTRLKFAKKNTSLWPDSQIKYTHVLAIHFYVPL